jgi:glycosyltransferase involved in cell wall biosynthesis
MTVWNIITGHYPPQPGGVSDYTRLVAAGLAAAGDEVNVWASPFDQDSSSDGVHVNRLPDHFGGRGLAILNRVLGRGRDSRVLVEYVPQAFGMKAMNLPLCLLLLRHRRCEITVMFHEVAYPIDRQQPLRHNLLGIVNRAMAATLARSASRIFVAAQAWTAEVARYAPAGCEIKWLPVPSTVGVADKCATFRKHKSSATRGMALVGHFGTYGSLVAERLRPALQKLLAARADTKVVLIGRNSEKFLASFIGLNPQMSERITATGALEAADVSAEIAACDLMLQPYPDGITSRNTSALTGLEHGRPMVTTVGRFTEDLWEKSGAVALAPDNDADAMVRCVSELADDRDRANAMSCAAIKLYREVFDLRHTIEALRAA